MGNFTVERMLQSAWSRVGWACLCVAVLSVISVAVLSEAVDDMLDREIETSIQDHAAARAHTWSQQFFRHVSGAGEIFHSQTISELEIQRFQDSLSISDVVRFKLFSASGELIYLSDRAIFASGTLDSTLAQAVFRSGETVTRIHENEGAAALPGFPDTYVRTMIPATTIAGERIGAIEAYVDVTALEASLERAFARASAYLIAGTALVMLLPIGAFVWRNTQSMKQDRKLLEMSRYDQLTGVLNRNSVSERLDRLFEKPDTRAGLGLLFVDLDRFKEINDAHGHQAGDALLAHIAQILKDNIRSKDDIVARYGGDEFLVLLPDIGRDELLTVSGRIVAAAREPLTLNGGQVSPSLSIGAYVATEDDTQRTALHRADLAVYAAKGNGRDQVANYRPDLERGRPAEAAAQTG